MKRIVKRVGRVLGVLALILFCLAYIGFYRGLTPLPKPPPGVRLEPRQPPLVREDLKPDNGAFYYVKAAELLTPYKQSKESDEQMDAVLAGDLSGDTKAIEQTLTDYHAALDSCREGTKASFTQMPWVDFSTNAASFLSPLRKLARLLLVDGKLAEQEGDLGRATNEYLTVVKLGGDCSRGATVVASLVGDAITGFGTQAIRAWALSRATSSQSLQNIIEDLNRIDREQTPYAETLRYELKHAKSQFENEIRGQLKPWQRALLSNRVMSRCFDAAFGDLIKEAEKPFWEGNTKAVIEKWNIKEKPLWLATFNRPTPRILIAMLLSALEPGRDRATRAELDVEATSVVCGLKAYELTHGKPPEQLTDLVPEFLASPPVDPFDGKPLRYRREGKEWVIWSVGADLNDDNAAWHEFKYRKRGETCTGGDIYFKSTEPQDDLAAYRARLKKS